MMLLKDVHKYCDIIFTVNKRDTVMSHVNKQRPRENIDNALEIMTMKMMKMMIMLMMMMLVNTNPCL